mmetsp:Transcript_4934/g.14994  ORF Transcript_4934/g.14994 Transcript_4934/m.14994 type:complete len:308 (-) Transcript_4934:439-1362(-)|eukprot:scaffold274501_cov30-Tisochrysis_lutea.AAC.1
MSAYARQRRTQSATPLAAAALGAALHQLAHTRHGLLLVVGGVVALLAAWYASPIGDWVAAAIVSTIPLHEDIMLGRRALAHQRFVYAESDYGVAEIGRQMVASSPDLARMRIPFSFAVIKQRDEINAFAFPGGAIFVTEALVRQLRATGPELAAVLGHEIGHVVHRHAQQRMVKSRLIPFLLDVIFYDDGDQRQETFGEATGKLLLRFAGQLGELAFSRANEYEADDVSWTLLLAAGHDPRALHSFFRKLLRLHSGKTGGNKGSVVRGMLSTHPATEERMQVLERRWSELPDIQRRRIERTASMRGG